MIWLDYGVYHYTNLTLSKFSIFLKLKIIFMLNNLKLVHKEIYASQYLSEAEEKKVHLKNIYLQ